MAGDMTPQPAGGATVGRAPATDALSGLMRRTYGPRVIELPEGFARLCSLTADGLLTRRYRRPVLASAMNGLGTRLQIAARMDRHDAVGGDLVALCVNDLVTVGAEPLYVLDYLALGRRDEARVAEIVRGVAEGCVRANCALIGGRAVERPGFCSEGEYDLAGTATGVVERDRIITGARIEARDLLVGIASSGLHDGGFSLAEDILLNRARLGLNDRIEELGCTLGEELLRPIRLYAPAVLALLNHYKVKHVVHGVAHVARGGLTGAIEPLLPRGLLARVRKGAWGVPPVFALLARLSGLPEEEIYRVFNMGVGMVVVVPPYNAGVALEILRRHGEQAWVIGDIRPGRRGVVLGG